MKSEEPGVCKRGLRHLNVGLFIVGLVFPLFHIALTTWQSWQITRAVARLEIAALGKNSASLDLKITGGICFSRPLASGVRIRVDGPGHSPILTFIDSDSPAVTPWDVSSQYVLALLLVVVDIIGYGMARSGRLWYSNLGQILIGIVVLVGFCGFLYYLL